MSPQLPIRKPGKNGPEVSALGFGFMGLSAFYGKPESDGERFKQARRKSTISRIDPDWD